MPTWARTLVMFLAVATAVASPSAQTCDWGWVNPVLPRVDLYRLKHESNTFVGVGAAGTTVRSTDGFSWKLVPSRVSGDLFGVDWGAGGFVAVGEGVILNSPNGLEWTTVHQVPGAVLRDVEFSVSRYVAVGTGLDGHVLASTLGRQWELVPVPWDGDPDSIAGSNEGFFVAVATEIWFSPDGVDWHDQGPVPATLSGAARFDPEKKTGMDLFELDRIDIAWTGSRLLWAGGSELWSRDGEEKWTLISGLGGCGEWRDWLGVIAGQGWAMASGISGCPTPYLDPTVVLAISVDGGASFQNPWETELGGFPGLARYGSRWVAVGALGDLLVSSNGASWDCINGSCTSLACSDDFVDLTVGDQGWLAVGGVGLCEDDLKRRGGGTTAVSTAARGPWHVSPLPDDRFRGATATGSGFLAVGDGWVARSSNGEDWITESSPENAQLRAVGSSDDWIVAVGERGSLYVSGDATTWHEPFLRVTSDLDRVVWDDGQFLVLGRGGTVLRSDNAMDWETVVTAVEADLMGAAAGPDQWIMVGSDGTILASEDGEVWLPRRSGVDATLRDVTWGDDRFAAVGWVEAADGTRQTVVLVSADGVHWTRLAARGAGLYRIRWTGDEWLAVGGDRAILVTDCLGTMIEPAVEHLQVPLDGTVDLLVRVSEAVATDTTLMVQSSDPARVVVPPAVTVPAGSDSVYVPVTGAAVVARELLTLSLPEDHGAGSTTVLVSVQPPQWTPRTPSGRVRP